jgi:hypothetical protein
MAQFPQVISNKEDKQKMTITISKLISLLLLGFVLFFGNIQQINYLSLQNRKSIILNADKSTLELKKETLLQQNQVKFINEIDKKIANNEIQQTAIGANNSETLEQALNKQKKPFNNTVIIAR